MDHHFAPGLAPAGLEPAHHGWTSLGTGYATPGYGAPAAARGTATPPPVFCTADQLALHDSCSPSKSGGRTGSECSPLGAASMGGAGYHTGGLAAEAAAQAHARQLERSNAELQRQCQELQARLEAAERQPTSPAPTAGTDEPEQVALLQRRLAAKEREAEAAAQALAAKQQQVAQREAELERERAAAAALRDEAARWRDECTQRDKEARALVQRLEAATTHGGRLDDSVASLRKHSGELTTALAQRDVTIRQLEERLRAVQGSEGSKDRQLEAAHSECQALRAECQALRGEHEALQQEGQQLRGERDVLHAECQALRMDCGALQQECQALHSELGVLRGEQQALQGERAALRQDNAMLQRRCQDLAAEQQRLSTALAEAQERAATLQRHTQELELAAAKARGQQEAAAYSRSVRSSVSAASGQDPAGYGPYSAAVGRGYLPPQVLPAAAVHGYAKADDWNSSQPHRSGTPGMLDSRAQGQADPRASLQHLPYGMPAPAMQQQSPSAVLPQTGGAEDAARSALQHYNQPAAPPRSIAGRYASSACSSYAAELPQMWGQHLDDRPSSGIGNVATPYQQLRASGDDQHGKQLPAQQQNDGVDGALASQLGGMALATPGSTASPFATETTLQDMLARTQALEDRLLHLNAEKNKLEAESARMPTNTTGRTLQERKRRAEVEGRLEAINKECSSVRLQLRRLGIR